MLVRAILETNLGTVIAMSDEDDKILFFDEDDEGGPATTIEKPEGLSIVQLDHFVSYLVGYLRSYDPNVEILGVVIEALYGESDLPE